MKKDESLDRLLERASRPHPGARPDGACLDAEALAAWTEGALSPAERAAAEAHAADCDRCLATLAAIAKIAPPASEIQRPAWLSIRWMLPAAAAAAVVIAVVLVQTPQEGPPGVLPAPPPASSTPPSVQQAPAAAAPAESMRDLSEKTRTGAAEKKEAPPPQPSARSSAPAEPRRESAPAAKEPAAQIDTLARDRTFAVQSRAAALAPPVIVSPDPNVRWRITGNSIERSMDGGRTWTAQTTSTDVPLLAGASPDPSVCWIVGRSGVVLRSTDGETWRRLDFPDPKGDLIGVTARDSRSATVTTVDGRTYRTDDGGLSWVLQENSSAAF